MTASQAQAGQNLIARIKLLAAEIQQVPSFGVDVWTMKGIHQKCGEIQECCAKLAPIVGTGDSPKQRRVGEVYPDTGN